MPNFRVALLLSFWQWKMSLSKQNLRKTLRNHLFPHIYIITNLKIVDWTLDTSYFLNKKKGEAHFLGRCQLSFSTINPSIVCWEKEKFFLLKIEAILYRSIEYVKQVFHIRCTYVQYFLSCGIGQMQYQKIKNKLFF